MIRSHCAVLLGADHNQQLPRGWNKGGGARLAFPPFWLCVDKNKQMGIFSFPPPQVYKKTVS